MLALKDNMIVGKLIFYFSSREICDQDKPAVSNH